MKIFRGLSSAILLGLSVCFIFAVSFGTVQIVAILKHYGIYVMIFGIVFYVLLCAITAGFVTLLFAALKKLHWKALFIILFSICFCIVLMTFSLYIMVVCICSIPAIYLLYKLIRGEFKSFNRFKRYICYMLAVILSISVLGTLTLVVWPGPSLRQDDRAEFASLMLPNKSEFIPVQQQLKNPAKLGEYKYSKLYYATPDQKIKPYPGKDIITSKATDVSKLVDGWSFVRRWQYGFGPEAIPLNGQVWMPEGTGPFPLVLIVHGNHEAGDRSDSGYDYIGEMLSRQGIITISVDENFLNSSTFYDLLIFASLKEENDARAFVLLEHLQLLYDWNGEEQNPFYGKINFDKLAIIGHSRGGEAAAIAAVYSHLKVNPDNGILQLNYPFSVNTVVAISPVNGQYLPAKMKLSLEGVNYLVLHGAQDMDVTSFMGSNMFRQADVDSKGIKAQVYIQHANHSQFNSVWGHKDLPGLMDWANNRNLLMPMEDQQEAAKVFIGAFLASTLQNQTDYNSLFENFSQGAEWLPKGVYAMDFISSDQRILANFEDDFDLTTASVEGVSFMAEGFSIWKETDLPTRAGGMMLNDNRVVRLEWHGKLSQPVFNIDISSDLNIETQNKLYISLCSGDEDRKNEVSFMIRLTDDNGSIAELPIKSFGGVPHSLYAPIYKFPFNSMIKNSEPVLQALCIPLNAFDGLSGKIIKIEWIFNNTDSTNKHILYIDDIRIQKK